MRPFLRLVACAFMGAAAMGPRAARAQEQAPAPPVSTETPSAEPPSTPPPSTEPPSAEPRPVEPPIVEPPPVERSKVRLPLRTVERPVSSPAAVLNPYLVLSYVHEPNHDKFANLDLGASVGITDDLTISARVAPLEIASPDGKLRYGERSWFYGPSFGALVQFLRGAVEMAGSLSGTSFTVNTFKGGEITPSLPIHFHATERLRLDAVPYAQIWFADRQFSVRTVNGSTGFVEQNANHTRLSLDLDAIYNLTDVFYVSVATGVTTYDVSNAGKQTAFPLGAAAGLTVMHDERGPVLDLVPFFTLPSLLYPSRSPAVSADWWRIGLEARGHFYL